MWKEAACLFKELSRHLSTVARKTTKICDDSLPPGREPNSRPYEYKAELTTTPRCSAICHGNWNNKSCPRISL